VRLKLRIGRTGSVDSVTVLDGNANFRTCIGDAVRRVRVPASVLGAAANLAVRVQ
jgi:hypothetical protein